MERAAELGYDAVEINHSMDAQMVGVILGARVLPVASVRAPAPLEQHPSAGWNRDINIASLDKAERALAVRYTQRSVDLEDLGAWFDLAGPHMIGAHLHDVRELTDHRAPGAGDVDFAALSARMPHFATLTLEIDQHEADETLVSGLDVLRGAGF